MTRGLGWLLVLLLASSCDVNPQEDPDATAVEDVPPIYESDASSLDDPLAEAMYAQAAACGTMSRSTVPVGWQQIMITGDGCTQWAPAHWVILGQYNDIILASDQSQKVAVFTHIGHLEGLDWTLPTLNNHAMALIEESFGSKPEVLHWATENILGIPTAVAVFTFDFSGLEMAGYIRIVFSGCIEPTNQCSAVFQGFWFPKDQMEAFLCTVAQVDASTKCPSGGVGCNDADCSSQCQATGHTGGQCIGDNCACF